MKQEIFEACLEAQRKNSGKKPFWEELSKKLKYGKTGEGLRNDFKAEKKRRGYFNPVSENYEGEEETKSYEEGDDYINVIVSSKRIKTKEDIVKEFNIDLDIWEIQSFEVKSSEGYRKDRQVSWHVDNGRVTTGDVEDTGKMLVVPMFHVRVRLVKKKQVAMAKSAIEALIEDAKKFSPVYPKINYKKSSSGCLYEIDMFDIHFGRLAWEEESGENGDIKIATLAVKSALNKLLTYVQSEKVSRILLPLGNDFFNVDSKFNTTTAGTPQQEDTRWQKTFRLGRKLAVEMIDACSSIAPVDVMIVPGNHDEQRAFYLGDSLECWYNLNKNVTVDNDAKKRKYYKFGKNLIGFTHGADEKLDRLPLLMAMEQPELWSQTSYREWHTGDKHHKEDIRYVSANENGGVTVRILRALAFNDAWTFNKGFNGSLRASEAFLWHPEKGLVSQFTATPEI